MRSVHCEYRETVVEQWIENRQQNLWRRHSDEVNAALLRRWLRSILPQVLMLKLGLVLYRVGNTCTRGKPDELVWQAGLGILHSVALRACKPQP